MATILTGLQTWVRELVIRSMAIAGIGASKTIARLKELGLGIRRAVGLAKYREYADIPKKEGAIKYISRGTTISRGLYTEAVGIMTRRYRYTVASEFYNPKTGQIQQYHTSMISDRPMTIGEIERTGIDVLTGLAGMYGATVRRSWIHLAEHREGDAWD